MEGNSQRRRESRLKAMGGGGGWAGRMWQGEWTQRDLSMDMRHGELGPKLDKSLWGGEGPQVLGSISKRENTVSPLRGYATWGAGAKKKSWGGGKGAVGWGRTWPNVRTQRDPSTDIWLIWLEGIGDPKLAPPPLPWRATLFLWEIELWKPSKKSLRNKLTFG